MFTPFGTWLAAVVTSAQATIVLPIIALSLIVGGLTWAWSNHEHGKAKVIAGLIGGAIALMAQPITVALQGSVPH